ncbi:hypothetical protein [Corallococcus aberystwythensis]|uniref:Cyanovirin-N domain-containing protein n=1 Tax=Corallococcus aberystwythensis TaxID=2316722 RepID=A0A3A8R6S9_9BACT|nr:hypothetical protein [Corallococcus aberystwythensis]RKH72952.1 hypothetical protein D7W81_05015 [Corallococcus aberystwythensis]
MSDIRRVIPLLALVFAFAPAASWAYKVECQNDFLVYVCGNGTVITCLFDMDHQTDCDDDPAIGTIACAGNGGFVRFDRSPGTRTVAEYVGTLDLAELQCLDCDNGENPIPVVTGNWTGVCMDNTAASCNELNETCFMQSLQFQALCAPRGGVKASFWHLDFPYFTQGG